MLRFILATTLAAIVLVPCAHGAEYSVDTTSDTVLDTCDDAIPDDCSLRGAITRANTTPDADSIAFAIPKSDPGYQADTAHWRIVTASMLPVVTNGALTIDGFTQAGATPNTNPPLFPLGHALRIELRGAEPGNINCLQSTASLTLRGLAMNNFGQAIFLFETGTHVIEGNHIGTDITGQQAVPNGIGVVLGGACAHRWAVAVVGQRDFGQPTGRTAAAASGHASARAGQHAGSRRIANRRHRAAGLRCDLLGCVCRRHHRRDHAG